MVTMNLFFKAFLLLSLALLAGLANATNITAQVDRNPVTVDESFVLTLKSDGSTDSNPDFSVLEKDFEILNTSQSNNMTYVNGKFTRNAQWQLVLIAKDKGVLTIPSVNFGKDRSPALRITVKDATSSNSSSTNSQKTLFLEVETDKKSSWVQAQLIYTVRLVRTVGINSASLNEPETSDPDAIIEKLGDDAQYESVRDGVRYAIIERRYAVYPQHSGKLTFKPILFSGQISYRSSRSLFDQYTNAGKTKRLRSKKLSVDIKPKPKGIKNNRWLPAKKIKLSQKWSDPVNKLKVGEPVTRTISINADGLMAAQLPEIKLPEINGLKQYPDQPVLSDKKTPEGIIGSRQIKIALIPSQNGEFKLPAIKIPWLNTRTGKQEIVRLPEVILKASGAASAANTSATTTSLSNQPVNPDTDIATQPGLSQTSRNNYWPWISLALAIGWIFTLIMLVFRKQTATKTRASKKDPPNTYIRPLEKTVLACSSNNDAEKTKNALLNWAKVRWPEHNITSLADIAQQSPVDLSNAIGKLNAALYSSKHGSWNGDVLARAFELFKNQKAGNSRSTQSVLEPLYKV